MADRPILFSGTMVRALLDGHKTQTRRIAKITAIMGNKVAITSPDERLIELEPGEFMRGIFHYESIGSLSGPYRAPYAVGDRLWVREAWSGDFDVCMLRPGERPDGLRRPIWYWADGNPEFGAWERPRPSIHMPRWASRITLMVTDIRVQRVQEISEADALSEGAPVAQNQWTPDGSGNACLTDKPWRRVSPARWFHELWDSLNAQHGYGWDENPWVVALTFTVERGNIDARENAS